LKDIIMSELPPCVAITPAFHTEDLDSSPKDVRFDAESYLLESLVNRDTLNVFPPKIDHLFDEFADELTRLHLIPPGIDIINLDPEGDILFLESLLYDNSSPRPPEAFQANSNTIIESLPISIDALREEIHILHGPDDSIPPGIKSNDFDSENDNNSTSLPEFESFHVDYPDSGDSTIDVVEDIPVDVPNILPTHPSLQLDFDFIPSHNDLGSDLDVSSPSRDRNKIYDPGICIEVESMRFLATLSPVIDTLLPFSSENEVKVFNHGVLASKEKSPSSSSHRGFKASKLFHHKSPMLIHGDNTPNLGVALDHYRDAFSVIYLIYAHSSNFEILTVLDIAYHAILTVLDIVYHAILTVLDIVYHAILTVLDIEINEIMPPRKAPRTRTTPATTTNTTSVTNAQLQAMIDQGVAAALATRDANRSTNGEDSHNSGTGVRRTERVARECTYQDFMKCQPLFFKGTEGVVKLTQWFERMETVFRISNCTVENQIKFSTCTLLGVALTWWNSHVRTVGHDVAYAMTWTDLKKKMTDKYCPRSEIKKLEVELWNLKVKGTDVLGYNQRFQELALLCVRMFSEESDKIEKYVGGLPDMIHGSVMASRPKTMQDAIEMATELMDKKISTLAEPYAARTGERKEYAGILPLCNRNHAATRNQGTLPCYECGNPGHYRSDCLELKNQNHVNQAEGTGARGMVYAFGGGETEQDINNIEDENEA
ncbi:reverse transcriptase domain-containing protein, partial [Tanacetum coccineum]